MSWILDNTLAAAVLALLVALACRLWRLPPVVRHGLWLIVLVKLIVPPVVSLGVRWPAIRIDGFGPPRVARSEVPSRPAEDAANDFDEASPALDPFALDDPRFTVADDVNEADEVTEAKLSIADLPPGSNRALAAGDTACEIVSAAPAAVEPPPKPDETRTNPLQPFPGDQDAPPFAESAQSPAPAGTIASIEPVHSDSESEEMLTAPSAETLLWAAAIAGTLAIVSVQGSRLIRLARVLKSSRLAPDDFKSLVHELAARLPARPPRVRLSSQINAPVVCALGQAVLLWPESRLEGLSDAARQAVIIHELAHLARRDHWLGWLELLASCGWWWNPLFWYVRHQLHQNAELACDAWVMALLPEGRGAYARALVDLAELDAFGSRPAAALGIGNGSRKLFERRLVMIMGDKVGYRLGALGLVAIGLLTLAALPGCSTGEAGEEAAPLSAIDKPLAASAASDTPDELAVEPARSVAEPAPDFDTKSPLPAAPETALPPPAADLAAPAIEGTADPFQAAPDAPGATSSTPTTPTNEMRLIRLEKQFTELLAEIRQLKDAEVKRAPRSSAKFQKDFAQPGVDFTASNKAGSPRGKMPHPRLEEPALNDPFNSGAKDRTHNTVPTRSDDGVEAVTLTRSTYRLPAGRAESLAAFFKANLTEEIEVRVKGDALQVTASADDQAIIGQFVRLVQTRGAPASKPEGAAASGTPRAVPVLSRVPGVERVFRTGTEGRDPASEADLLNGHPTKRLDPLGGPAVGLPETDLPNGPPTKPLPLDDSSER